MNLRRLKRRHDARHTRGIKAYAIYQAELAAAPDYWPDEDHDDDTSCTHCGGEGFGQVEDPLWDECDEFGEGPCKACGGTGRRADQTVF